MRTELKKRRDKQGLPFFDVYINGQYQGSYVKEEKARDEIDVLLKGVCI